jgi:SAM-dependent methyltransferase
MPDEASEIDRTDSTAWQSTSQAEALGAYLQRVAAMPVLREVAARSLALMALQPGQRVVEVGCGPGAFLPSLAEAVGPPGAVVGVDRSVPFVEQARERTRSLPGVRVDVGDAYALPYPDGSFDVAHCERILMHLDDPTAALREMRRVVGPGGRVVAAEPAWATLVIDHPDHEAVGLLVRQGISGTRNPRMGLELNRRLAEAGLVERGVEVVALCSRDYAELVAYGLDLRAAAAALAADGRGSRARPQHILDDLIAASGAGTFFAFAGFFLAHGRVPARRQS